MNKWQMTMAAMQTAMNVMVGIQAAKADDGKVDAAETADIIAGAAQAAAVNTGLAGRVVYQPGEEDSTASRIATGLIAAGTAIQKSLKDDTLTVGEVFTAIRTGVAHGFVKSA